MIFAEQGRLSRQEEGHQQRRGGGRGLFGKGLRWGEAGMRVRMMRFQRLLSQGEIYVSLFGKIPWRRAWLPSPVFLPGEFHAQRSLVGYSPWDHKEADKTKQLTLSLFHTAGILVTPDVEGGLEGRRPEG